jgi:hypothetical protein
MIIQTEPYEDFIKDAKHLYPAHWDELALNKDKVLLDVNYKAYSILNEIEPLLVVTIRDNGRLVGYYMGFVAFNLHYKTCLELIMDIFWTHPDIRGGFDFVKMFREVELEAKRRGVHRIHHSSKLHKDCSVLFKRLGMTPVETLYSKWIGD